MIDAKRLLADLKRQHKRLENDLRTHHAASGARAAVEAEWREAFEAKRTADTFETFFDAALDQAAVHWILGAVFLRFLEDNRLIEQALLAGEGERGERARRRQDGYFRAHPYESDAEYLLATFAEVGQLPGVSGLFHPAHNPAFRMPLSGDGARELIGFFRLAAPETGTLVHDFSDPDWGAAKGTRWLGDLYQDLSEAARKHFALLQTPDFIESWILDRTLEPAIREFGHEAVRLIDPACGSGHFLLGGFARLLREWQSAAPGMPPAAAAQRALDAVSGVDLNPFAVEIARFRLLLVALHEAQETRLSASPNFRFQLAVGDSLLHGRHFARHELGGAAEGFGRTLRHHYAAEDSADLDRILGRQYHAVVGNPPYITPKDAAMRNAYREIYTSCYRTYGLAAPFIERFFDLAQPGTGDHAAGFVGLIASNSFMKREFGKKLIEEVLPRLDLTHVVDCSGAYIPGHGTPTVILFGRNRAPVGREVRAVMGIRGEPATPEGPAHGKVWSAIVAQTDNLGSVSEFVSVADVQRAALSRHPWSIGGGGVEDLQRVIESGRTQVLGERCSGPVGGAVRTGADEAFGFDRVRSRHSRIPGDMFRDLLSGENVREWAAAATERVYYPYTDGSKIVAESELWPWRTTLSQRVTFQGVMADAGLHWAHYMQHTASTFRTALSITFAEVATHNHFVLDRGGKVFKQTAPVIKLPAGASEDDHLGLLGLLNSSAACFWLKQACYPKGGDHVGQEGARVTKTRWDERYSFNGANVERFPLAANPPLDLARALDAEAHRLGTNLPSSVVANVTPTRAALDAARAQAEAARGKMIALQEELDWRCYRLYGLLDDAPEHPDPPPLRLGQRAFEIVMARRMAERKLESAWFTRHRSMPITEIPAAWPADYRAIVARRIELIENDANIGLIERPEYKRRWSAPRWEELERDALRAWLLDRLERRGFWPEEEPRIISTSQLADAARRDAEFVAVAELYGGAERRRLEALVADLASREAVPFLAILRYSESGLRKRAQWGETWEKQRQEDAIDTEIAARRGEFAAATRTRAEQQWRETNPPGPAETPESYAARMKAGIDRAAIGSFTDRLIAEEQKREKTEKVGAIPVPPKYRTGDFLAADCWRQRGGLDVPKERFVSFPHCARDADGSLPILWAGYDALARARAIATYYVERKERDGWAPGRLKPLLAGLQELLPWVMQWHNEYDPRTGMRMGDYYTEFLRDEAKSIEMSEADLRNWIPPAPARRPRGSRRAAS